MNSIEIDREKLLPDFWNKYSKTKEFKSGLIMSINSNHPLVRQAEEEGITLTYKDFQEQLLKKGDIQEKYANRTKYDWIMEWNSMHYMLFSKIYKQELIGRYRRAGEDVYFGDPDYIELFNIPKGVMVASEYPKVANIITEQYRHVNTASTKEVCDFLAEFHFMFIRVHPYLDGNGRIARAAVDRLSLSLNHTPVLAGFPRNNAEAKRIYHNALVESAKNRNTQALSEWIYDQMKNKLNMA